jgi:crotonobetainyl-CoA:carnitine CoA-transferase CaiB-like acyl-CoA transferase
LFLLLNAAKRSLALDLKTEAGREALRRLVGNYDILVESFRPGVLDRLGVGYEQLKREQPGLIFAAVTGYGAAGPWRDRAGHDINYCALAGVTSLTGGPDGRPVIPGVQLADLSGGLYAALAIVAAVHGRAQHGQGCFIDIAMADTAQALLTYPYAEFFPTGRPAGPAELTLTGARVCYGLYATRDGRWMALGALEPKFWQAFCRAAGKPHLAHDGFAEARPGNPVYDEVAAFFASRTQAEWSEFFAAADCCCEPVLRLDEAVQHPHFAARGALRETEHPVAGRYREIAQPCRFTPPLPPPDRPAPALGEHTREVLREAGVGDDEFAAWAARGAFGPGNDK